MVFAPFAPDQVASMNAYQVSGVMHPFTCSGGHAPHGADAGDAGHRVGLVASASGWDCPAAGCTYRQDWAHAFMVDFGWRSDDAIGDDFAAHADESLALAHDAFEAAAETWPAWDSRAGGDADVR